MAELLSYPTEQLPPMWKWQVLSFLRAHWPDGFLGENRLRDWITKAEDHPHSFILVEHDLLLGHVNVVWKELEHAGTTFRAYGLTGVFTYPSFQRQGYGLRLVQHATDYIDTQDADVALLTCDWALSTFYGRAGWEPLPHIETVVGPRTEPVRDDGLLMMRFISPKGQRYHSSFERGQLYIWFRQHMVRSLWRSSVFVRRSRMLSTCSRDSVMGAPPSTVPSTCSAGVMARSRDLVVGARP